MKRVFLKVLVAGYVWGLCAGADLPQFDAASVKITNLRPTFPMRGNQPDVSRPSSHFDPGRVDFHIVGLRGLVSEAWPLADYQIVWPSGIPDGRFDVSATMPPDTTRAQFQLMLRRLLAERFKLATHMETRDTKVYALQVSPRGLKIVKAANPPLMEGGHVWFGGRHLQPGSTNPEWFLSSTTLDAPESAPSGMTISELAKGITQQQLLDHPLVDATGLDGYYEIELTIPRLDVDSSPGDPGVRRSNRPNGPELLDAIEKQLGLKAVVKTMPVETLVIDHVEAMPSEN